MKRKLTITVVIDPEAKEIVVKDDAGNTRPVKSIMMFGGDAASGALYLFGWGASADAAWAYTQGFLHAFRSGDRYFKSFYKQCACHIVQSVAPDAFRQMVDAGEVLEKWAAEDGERETMH